jgi:DNA polymerase III sliding clamp (beta) subunit (PCNA family)
MNELELLQKIIAFSENVACRDEIRYALQGVCLQLNDSSILKVIATDGHRLVQETVSCPDSLRETMNKMNKKEIIVSSSNIKMLKLFMKQNGKNDCYSFIPFTGTNGINNHGITLRYMGNVLVLELLDVEYPDVNQILKGLKKGTHKISFNAEYLYKLSKAMKKDNIVVLELNLDEKLAPITINYENTLGILMPCRV